jgi:hypothetical protein
MAEIFQRSTLAAATPDKSRYRTSWYQYHPLAENSWGISPIISVQQNDKKLHFHGQQKTLKGLTFRV